MNTIRFGFKSLDLRDQRGQGLTEYIILLMLIAVVSITAVRSLGTTVKRKIQDARQEVDGMRVGENGG